MTERKVARRYTAGGDRITPEIPDGYYTRTMVVRETGVSLSTLRRMHRNRKFVPEKWILFGQTKVWLYTEDQVLSMKEGQFKA